MSDSEARISSFRPVPRTGVIYVTTEARKRGFSPESTDWCNLGQGQPEAGELAGGGGVGTVGLNQVKGTDAIGLTRLEVFHAVVRRGMNGTGTGIGGHMIPENDRHLLVIERVLHQG